MPNGEGLFVKQSGDSSGDISKARVADIRYLVLGTILGVVIKDTGDGVSRVGSLEAAIRGDELFGITMVGGDNHHAFHGINGGGKALKLEIDGFKRNDSRLHFGGVANHITTRVIDADEFVGFEVLEDSVGNLGRFHPGAIIKGVFVGRNLNKLFA